MCASRQSQKKSFIESLYIRLNQRQGLALYNEIAKKEIVKPSFSLSTFLAYLLSAMVYIFMIVFFALGVLTLIKGYRHIATVVLALLFFGLSWFARPRFNKLPKHPIDRRSSPSLYQVVDILAKSLGTRIDVIELNEEYSASTYFAGLRQTRVLSLGLPLLAVLTDDEKAALICHELAHNVNGDVTNSMFIGVAMNSLIQWYRIISSRYGSRDTVLEVLSDIILMLVAQFPLFILNAINILSWRVHQRAEYLADLMAARICGTNATLSLSSKVGNSSSFESAVRICGLSSNRNADIFRELEKASFSGIEIDSIQAETPDEELDWGTDPYHPPMPLRARFLKARFYAQGEVKIPAELFRSIDNEIEPLKSRINTRLIDLYRASITIG